MARAHPGCACTGAQRVLDVVVLVGIGQAGEQAVEQFLGHAGVGAGAELVIATQQPAPQVLHDVGAQHVVIGVAQHRAFLAEDDAVHGGVRGAIASGRAVEGGQHTELFIAEEGVDAQFLQATTDLIRIGQQCHRQHHAAHAVRKDIGPAAGGVAHVQQRCGQVDQACVFHGPGPRGAGQAAAGSQVHHPDVAAVAPEPFGRAGAAQAGVGEGVAADAVAVHEHERWATGAARFAIAREPDRQRFTGLWRTGGPAADHKGGDLGLGQVRNHAGQALRFAFTFGHPQFIRLAEGPQVHREQHAEEIEAEAEQFGQRLGLVALPGDFQQRCALRGDETGVQLEHRPGRQPGPWKGRELQAHELPPRVGPVVVGDALAAGDGRASVQDCRQARAWLEHLADVQRVVEQAPLASARGNLERTDHGAVAAGGFAALRRPRRALVTGKGCLLVEVTHPAVEEPRHTTAPDALPAPRLCAVQKTHLAFEHGLIRQIPGACAVVLCRQMLLLPHLQRIQAQP